MRGLRLPQPPNVSDDLYQLMLNCWQIDLDERPNFDEILQVLHDMDGVNTNELRCQLEDRTPTPS